MKQIYLLLLLLIGGCASFQSSELASEDIEEITDVRDIEDIISDVEKTTELSEDKSLFIVREDGVEVALDIEFGRLRNTEFVFYKFHGRDLVGRTQDGLNWKAYIYLTKSDLVEIPFCTSKKISDQEWVSTHCIEEHILKGYGDGIKIVYTSRQKNDLRNLSHFKIANLDDALVFNSTKPL